MDYVILGLLVWTALMNTITLVGIVRSGRR